MRSLWLSKISSTTDSTFVGRNSRWIWPSWMRDTSKRSLTKLIARSLLRVISRRYKSCLSVSFPAFCPCRSSAYHLIAESGVRSWWLERETKSDWIFSMFALSWRRKIFLNPMVQYPFNNPLNRREIVLGFDQIINGTEFAGAVALFVVPQIAQNDDRNFRRGRVFTQSLHHFKPVQLGKDDVQKNQIRKLPRQHDHRLFSARF